MNKNNIIKLQNKKEYLVLNNTKCENIKTKEIVDLKDILNEKYIVIGVQCEFQL